ncbi:MAG TPA: hypothetical protein VI318_10945, partial [Baekduia sp.]
NGIAFDPGNPDRGYAIGKQGVLLRYDRQWTQEPLPDGLDQANFTSIAFAGHEAIVTYQLPLVGQAGVSYTGGVIVNDGSGWRRDQGVTDVLPASDGGRSVQQAPVPIRAAGLPDGSAAVATIGGIVVERSGATGPWTRTPATPSGFPTALAAFHDESGAVRAVVSLDLGVQTAEELASTDSDVILNPPAPGQPPILTDPYKLPHAGMVLRETVSGWHDDQHQYYEDAGAGTGLTRDYDQPEQPDAVQAFLIDPFGRNGWGVGGQTGDLTSTAGVVRYPDDGAAPPGTTDAPIVTDGDKATFAIGGGAQCLDACAALEQVGAGPWRWLPAAVGRAAQTSGVRAFLYTGDGIAPGQSGSTLTREEGAYARRLTERAGALPVFAAAASSDLGPDGRLDAFRSAFDAAATAPLGSGAPVDTITTDDRPRPGQGYYSFDSTGSTGPGGNVRVIFVDASSGQLGDDQRCWLATQLSEAAMESAPAIVIGSRPVDAVNTASPAGPGTVDGLADAAAVSQILVTGAAPPGCTLPGAQGGASAYFYNFPNENRSGVVTFGDDQIPAYGSGSLGYVVPEASQETHNPGASGWLLAEVDVASRDPSTNRAPVAVPRLIPNVGEIAVEASDGTLLRRSQVALFDGLARRPRSGLGCYGAPSCIEAPSQYLPIPFTCIGSPCESTLAPDYSFTSSDPTVADFVAHDPTSLNPRRVLIGPDKKPVPAATGGLLCAYNPGTTTITLTAGGMSYSQKVTVLAGSVQQPCGTVPANGTRTSPPRGGEDPIQNPLPTEPTTAPPVGGVTPIPPPPVPAVHATPVKHVPPAQRPPVPLAVAPFVPISSGLTQVVAIPPPPPPTAARPAPPSGTSSANVYQSAVAPERQRDEEHAVDHAHNMVRYEPDATRLVVMRGGAVLMLILGGLALAGARPRPRRNYAYNTTDRRSPRS